MAHTVLGHLDVRPDEYDAAIRVFVPHYEEMIAAVVAWLRGHVPDDGLVVDLGAGTGALSEAILAALPVRVCLVDVDPAMLEVARGRLARFADRIDPKGGSATPCPPRIELRQAAFADPLPRCHAAVASLALHHVPDPDDKRALYRRIREALLPGGLLAIADATVHESGPTRERIFADWAAWMVARGATEGEARERFAQWAREDRYFPLPTELALLADAGFPQPDCWFRRGPATVYGGFA